MKKVAIIFLSFISILLYYNYINLKDENEILQTEIRGFKKEIDNLKNGTGTLINKAKFEFNAGNYNEALSIIKRIKSKYSNENESIEAGKLYSKIQSIIEKNRFQSAIVSGNKHDLEKFIISYPNSKYQTKVEKELENYYYNEALRNNSTVDYELFIEKYPKSSKFDEIKKLLDKRKFNDLLSNTKNKLPDFNVIKDEYYYDEYIEYKYSSVEIENKTNSNFIVYFKGEEYKEVIIGVNETVKTVLKSGMYDIILSKGDYNKTFYHLEKKLSGNYTASYTENNKKTKKYTDKDTYQINPNYFNSHKTKQHNNFSNDSYKRTNNTYQKIRVGAICNDGTRSYATGRGACSHHGGVNHWLYE